jgi:hypothetical protein
MKRHLISVWLCVVTVASLARGEDITIATYNIENFREHFLAHKLSTSRPNWLADTPEAKELLDAERKHNDEENWEVSQVILDPNFSPDILVVQEGCGQKDLEFFGHRWLNDAYETLIVFPTNTAREQNLCLLTKPGFKIIERKDRYHEEPDAATNERGARLFARGPAFVLVESPRAYRFWVGTNHQKSKSDNSVEVTEWRNREAKRTHQIIKELEKTGPADVVFLGDMNDEQGIQEYEQQGGGDVIANLVGPPEEGIVLATKPLADAGQISYGGCWRTDRRSFIDHILVTAEMKDQIVDVKVFRNSFTQVASDHYPVMIRIRADDARPLRK